MIHDDDTVCMVYDDDGMYVCTVYHVCCVMMFMVMILYVCMYV